MPDEQSPVAVLEAPESQLIAPSTSTDEQATSSDAGETKAPEAPAAPDYKSLAEQVLGSPDGKRFLLDHPEIAKEMKHRVESVRKADVAREVRQGIEAYQKEQEAERQREEKRRSEANLDRSLVAQIQRLEELEREDPTNPAVQNLNDLRQLVDQRVKTRQDEEWQSYQAKLRRDVSKEAGDFWLNMLTAQVEADDSLSDDEKKELNPRDPKWATPDDFFKAWRKASTSNEARKIAKDLAKVEVEAQLQERLGKERTSTPGPAHLPPGEKSASVSEFFSEYASGRNSDHGKALDNLRKLGLQI